MLGLRLGNLRGRNLQELLDRLFFRSVVRAELDVERRAVRKLHDPEQAIGILEVERFRRGGGEALPSVLRFVAIGRARKKPGRFDAARRLGARNHGDFARDLAAIAQGERQLQVIGGFCQSQCMKELRAFQKQVEVPASVVIRPAGEQPQALEQFFRRMPVDRLHAGTEKILLCRRRARDDERVREPEESHRRAAFGEPGAIVRMPGIVAVIGECRGARNADQELGIGQFARPCFEGGHMLERSTARFLRKRPALEDIAIAQDDEIRATATLRAPAQRTPTAKGP